MTYCKHLFVLIIAIICCNISHAQVDTSFWFAAPAITPGHENKPIVFRMATYSQAADIVISSPANPNFIPYTTHLNSNSATTIDVTDQIDVIENKPGNSITNYGLKITATANISAYYEEGILKNPEIFPLKGKIGMGIAFLIPSQTRFANKTPLTPPAHSGFAIVATENNTNITITLMQPDSIGHSAGVPFSIILNRGQSYAVIAASSLAAGHLGGSTLKADKPVCVTIYDDSVLLGTNYDLIGDQIVPEVNTGNEFIIIRGALNYAAYPNQDFFYVWATADNTIIWVNGLPAATINRGQSYEGLLANATAYVTTNSPVYVLQFTGTGQEVATTSLPNIKCTGSSTVSFVRSTSETFYLNILCKATDVSGFQLNGSSGIITPSLFSPVAGTNGNWQAARISIENLPSLNSLIPAGAATLVTNSLGLFHLGFLNGATTTGSRLGYFSNYGIAALTPLVVNNICLGNNLQLQANQIANTSYLWSGPNGFSSTIYNPVIANSSAINSGTYYVTANVQGCGSFTDSLPITIYPKATASFGANDTICYGGSKLLSVALTGKAPWTLVYNDGIKADTVKQIATSPYTFSVLPKASTTYTITSVTDATPCAAGNINVNDSITIVVNPLPTAVFSGGDTLCIGKNKILNIALTGKAPWKITYNNGVDTVTVNNILTSPYSFTIAPIATTTYILTVITDANGCSNTVPVGYTVKVFAKATTNFSILSSGCVSDSLRFIDSSNSNNQPITKWNWDFGDGSTDTLQNTKHRYATAGTKTVKLYSITDKGCFSDTASRVTLVNPLPSAGFSYAAIYYCETRPVTFTDSSKANVGNLVRWHWLMGDGRVVDSTNGNPFNHTYAAYGTYAVKLMVESNKGCKSDTLSKAVVINPLPHVGFIVPAICLSDVFAQFTDTSTIADGSPLTIFSWGFDASTATPTVLPAKYPTPLSSILKNPQVQYKQSSNYFVKETVTSNKGCTVSRTNPFSVNGIRPKSGFVVLDSTHLCSNTLVKLTDLSTVDFGTVSRLDLYWNNAVANPVDSIDQNPANKTYGKLYPDFQNPTKKTYQLKLVARSGNSAVCADSVSQTITINQSPKVQFIAMAGICNDTTARQITQAKETTSPALTGIFSYTGTGVNSTGLFLPRNVSAGTYNIQYKYSSSMGCSDSATQPVTVWPSPVAKWGASSLRCANNDISFTDSSVANYGKIQTWIWNYGDGTATNRSDSLPYQYRYAAAGSYGASLRVTTDSGCHSPLNIQTLKINYLPKVSFTLPTICLPDGNGTFSSTSTIGDGSQALFSYAWGFGDPNNSSSGTTQVVGHRYSALPPTGGYAVKLAIATKDGCQDSLTQGYTDVNPQPTAAFSATPQAVCVRSTIGFADNSDGKTSAVSKWYWDLAQGQTSNAQGPSRQFSDSGSYQVRLWVDNAQGCRSDTAEQTVTVNPYPIVALGPNLAVLEGGTVALRPQIVYGTSLVYLWTASFPLGSPTYLDNDTARVPKSTPAATVDSIIYNLQLTGIGGCAVTANITVVVLHAPVVPNTFSPNGDGVNDRWVIKSLESYPGATIEIYNRYGQVVYKATVYDPNNAWDGTLNGSPLPLATYYYIIDPKNGRGIISGSITIIR